MNALPASVQPARRLWVVVHRWAGCSSSRPACSADAAPVVRRPASWLRNRPQASGRSKMR